MPTIAVMNESTSISNLDVQGMIPAFSQQWNNDLKSIWRVEDATFQFVLANQTAPPGSWWCVFLDDSDQAGALAYHDLTDEGLPLSKVFVKSLQADNSSISVGATHELCEMAVDPWLNGAYQDSQGTFWAAEIADPVESDVYGYLIASVTVTDFVTPAWFAYKSAQGSLDIREQARAPFEVLSGGYAQKFDPASGWVQVTGASVKGRLIANAAKGSRRERRARGSKNWILSQRS